MINKLDVNARSFCDKIGDLNLISDQFNPSFIFINESWLSDRPNLNNSMIVSDKK